MMRRLCFCQKWLVWIKVGVESASISIHDNGSPTEEFKAQRGLWHGNPIAPLLFLMVAEGLSGLMRQAKECNLFSRYLVGEQKVQVSLLQFADDTLFFANDSMQNIFCIKSILCFSELALGLKSKFFKSKLVRFG